MWNTFLGSSISPLYLACGKYRIKEGLLWIVGNNDEDYDSNDKNFPHIPVGK